MLTRCSLIPRCIQFFKTVCESEFLYASHLLIFGSRQPYCYPKYFSQTYIICMPYHSLLKICGEGASESCTYPVYFESSRLIVV